MKIPLIEKLPPDLRIPRGPYKGQQRYYKTALWNTLIHLHPKVCLEIGTWKGGSAKIFRQYFEQYRQDGILITVDVKKYTNVADRRVCQVLVYPHDLNICKTHHVTSEQMLPGWADHANNSVEDNVAILKRELHAVGAKAFNFAFVDGDHWNLLKDIEIVRRIVAPPSYALLDDTQSGVWDCTRFYKEDVMPQYNHYEFDDWDIFVGTSLIWEKS